LGKSVKNLVFNENSTLRIILPDPTKCQKCEILFWTILTAFLKMVNVEENFRQRKVTKLFTVFTVDKKFSLYTVLKSGTKALKIF